MRIVLLVLAAVLIAMGTWVVVRAFQARDTLTEAAPLVRAAQGAVLHGDTAAALVDIAEVQRRTAEARSLTGDPVWRAVEIIPLVGPNLTAFRQAAEVIDDVAQQALPSLATAAQALQLDDFVPQDGRLDVQPLVDARPLLEAGATAMAAAAERADAIDTSGVVPQIGIAVDQLIDLVDEADGLVDGVASAAEILPGMLGYEGERNYVLLALNNAELRAAGGIPGAVALISADDGRLALGTQTSAAAFGRRDEPLPLTETERTLYSDNMGRFVQNVTSTPWFDRTGELTAQRWAERYGEVPDGVLSVDPVALSYILAATGPIEVHDGVTLDADNAVEFLLSGVYERYANPSDQDAFFARAFSVVFDRLASGELDAQTFVNALVTAGSERRLLVWSADPAEQEILARGELSGHPPAITDDAFSIGVYYHDVTESKMDWYLRSGIRVSSIECRNDERPYIDVKVDLESVAPAAAGALPGYVTGSKFEGNAMRTGVFVYVPAGSEIYDVQIDGEHVAWTAASDELYEVAAVQRTLEPGESAVLTYRVLGPAGETWAVKVDHTPMAFELPVSLDNLMACPDLSPVDSVTAVPAPTSESAASTAGRTRT